MSLGYRVANLRLQSGERLPLLGIWFSGLMVLFAGACVLYDTSRIIHDYPADRPAGAALHLFASIALMLWYVLRILISLAMNDD